MTDKATRKRLNLGMSPDEKNALFAFGKQLKLLSFPKGDDIVLRCEVDLSARYGRLLKEIKSYKGPMDLGGANKILSSLLRAVPKVPKTVNAHIWLTGASVTLAADILGEAVRFYSQRCNEKRALELLIRRCGSTLMDLAGPTNDGGSWAPIAGFFQAGALTAGLNFEALVSEHSLGSTFTTLRSGLTNSLLNLLEHGNVTAARQLLAVCARHSEFIEICRSILKKALSERASTLPRESQEVALRFLGATIESKQVDYVNPAESPEIRQAAALFLYLSDVRHHTPELEEAFDRYRSVAEHQLNLHLRGVVGSTMPFDPRLHESPEPGDLGQQVKVIRPWVEWYRPPDAFVVIRGMVESESSLKEERP